jgi:predicted ArsR family transcriptional regulator
MHKQYSKADHVGQGLLCSRIRVMPGGRGEDAIVAVASLGDGVRRELYEYVSRRGRPVGREEAATAVGVKRPLAAYHLDRLARDGLLDVHYERPPGRGGPGAGRPAKLYRRTETELSVSLPPRRYDLAARLLAATVEELGAPASAALAEHAEAAGSRLADESALPRAGEASPEAATAALTAALKDHGYEPYDDGEAVRLRNCPFHHLAQRHLSLVCGMNLSLLVAAVARCPALPLSAVLEPRPGHCCVAFRPRPA